MPSHNTITDPNIHEPKGISTAPQGMFYISDGNGSGNWTYWPLGKAYYQHSTTGQIITSTPSKLLIDGAGPLTRTANLPREIRGSGQLWSVSNNRVNPIRLYDGYSLRVDIPITAESGSPTSFKLQLEVGAGSTVALVMYETYFPTGKTLPYTISFNTSFDVLTNETLNNGVELFCSVNIGTVTVGSPAIYISKISDGLL